MNRKIIAILLIGGAALAASWNAAAQSSPGDYIMARDVPAWFKQSFLDFEEDVAEAAEAGRRVMIYFGQDGCPYCRKLHETSFKDAEVLALLQDRFDSVAVNIFGDVETVWPDGEEGTEKELAARLQVQFTPTLLFLDEDGQVIVRVNGYRPVEWMRPALQYVAERKEREGIAFKDYMRAQAPPKGGADKTAAIGKFAAPRGDLDAPGKRTIVYISQSNCELCDEWDDYFSEHSDKWATQFRLVAIDRYGERAAAAGLSESEWAKDKNIAFAPALVFLQPDGSELFRAEAYLRPFHLETVVEYALAGATQADPEFQRFLQNRADNIREGGGTVSIW